MEAVDLNRLTDTIGGDRALLTDMLRIFRLEAPQMLRHLEDSIGDEDLEGVISSSHRIKGAVLNFAALGATQLAQDLEMTARAGSLEGAPARLWKLKLELRRMDQQLRGVLAQL